VRFHPRLPAILLVAISWIALASPGRAFSILPDPITVELTGQFQAQLTLIGTIQGASPAGGLVLQGSIGAGDTVLVFHGSATGNTDLIEAIGIASNELPMPSAVGWIPGSGSTVNFATIGFNSAFGPFAAINFVAAVPASPPRVNFFVSYPSIGATPLGFTVGVIGNFFIVTSEAQLVPEPRVSLLAGAALVTLLGLARRLWKP
jgi:hypothetical protein